MSFTNCIVPTKLDPGFTPLVKVFESFQKDVKARGDGRRFVVAIERSKGLRSPFECLVYPDGVNDQDNILVIDRIVKSLLWMRGGYKVLVSGSKVVFDHLKKAYSADGSRAFDWDFMANVFEKPFEVLYVEDADSISEPIENAEPVGQHLDGCRIGFDAGGSDRKVSAVIDGEAVYSEEVVWHPKVTADPDYHYKGILTAMQTAASHMPRVDGIGVSSAGVYIDNRIMNASLFLKVPKDLFDKKVKTMYIDIAKTFGDVPLVVANDGDVTALAGAMNLHKGNVLGIAMGTSEAGGYVDHDMHIMGWLNELAFVPVDANPDAMVDEWSGDYGCGVKYFSQDAVIKLAPAAGIALDENMTPAEKLKVVQGEMEKGNPGAAAIYETIGEYFAYAIAYYAMFYTIEEVLILGRVTSGEGGVILLDKAQQVLDTEFPELAKVITLTIPDEESRRVGQSVAAASLPDLRK